MDSAVHFLVNLFAMLVGIIYLQYHSNKYTLKHSQLERAMFITLMINIVICMMVPFKVDEGIVFDLRFIPFALGCFYTSRTHQRWMLFTIILLRINQGFVHSWFGIGTILGFYPVFLLLQKRYQHVQIGGKINILMSMMAIMGIWVLLGDYLFFQAQIPMYFGLFYVLIHVGGAAVFASIIEAIREQHMILHRMIRMEKMEAVSHLAASISHEVRNPLTSARGFMQLTEESDEISERLREYITIAKKELDHAETIIRNYLTFAKPAPEHLEVLDIQEEIEHVIHLMKPMALMNTVNFECDIHPGQVNGNRGWFQQVIVNIIKNGIEAMPTGGTLRIQTKKEKEQIYILIRDEGVGMSDIQKSRLGEPYYSTKDGNGTGLGMMVVFRIIENMKGKIQISSELGKGTSITLAFPEKES